MDLVYIQQMARVKITAVLVMALQMVLLIISTRSGLYAAVYSVLAITCYAFYLADGGSYQSPWTSFLVGKWQETLLGYEDHAMDMGKEVYIGVSST